MATKELHEAVLHGNGPVVQAMLLRPLINGTAEDLERKIASRAAPMQKLRAAERALEQATAAETGATKTRVAANELYHAIISEGDGWAGEHEAEVVAAAGSPKGRAEDVIIGSMADGSPRLLSQDELQRLRRKKARSARTFSSDLAQRAVLPSPWEPLASALSAEQLQTLTAEEQLRAEAEAHAPLKQKHSVNAAALHPPELAQLRQIRWVEGMADLRATRIGRILYDPDAIKSHYDLQNNPPWMTETKQLLSEWAHAHGGPIEWEGTSTVSAKIAKDLFESLLEVGVKDSGCDSWQSEVQWVVQMLTEAIPQAQRSPSPRRSPGSGGRSPRSPRSRGRSAATSSQLRQIFQNVDQNRDGSVSRAEVILRLRKDKELAILLDLPTNIHDDDLDPFEQVFQSMDAYASGNIDADEFVRYCELQYQCQNHFEFSIENAEIMWNCP